jgi:hypothetical protein
VLGGCGYSSEEECRLKEMQKCESKSCEYEATNYCDSEFPGGTTRIIYDKKSYPEDWVTVTVDDSRVYLKERISRYKWVKVCLKKGWTLGEGRCHEIWLNRSAQKPNGTSVIERLSEKDWFHEYVNEAGDGLKETTVINVSSQERVGFFRYHFDWIFKLFLWGIAILFSLGIIMSIVGVFLLDDDDEEEENKYGMDFKEGDEVEIPERALLWSMTKDEIKAWADVFEFNVPSSLNKAEMIDRFVEETDAYVESLEE